MKLQILSEQLQKKLSFLNHAVSQRSQLPILLNVAIQAKDGKLILQTTDLEIGIHIEMAATINEEGSATVPAKLFSELIATLPNEKLTLQLQGENLEIMSKKTKSILQTTKIDDFPKLFEEKGQLLTTFSQEILQKDIGKVVFSASQDVARPALSGILLKKEEEGFLLVATDGYRLSLQKIATDTRVPDVSTLLVPSRIIKEVLLLKEEGDVDVYSSLQNNQILFSQKETIIVGRLIEAEFPKYEKIIPQDAATHVSFDRQELQKAVKICAIFARETANIIKLSLQKNKIVVSANTPQVGQNTVEVEAALTGEENEIAFNARYLLDFCSNVTEDDVLFEMSGPLNPGMFKIKDNQNFLHIIMPIRVQG